MMNINKWNSCIFLSQRDFVDKNVRSGQLSPQQMMESPTEPEGQKVIGNELLSGTRATASP